MSFRVVTTITFIVILVSLVLIWIFAGASRLNAQDTVLEQAETTSTGGETVLTLKVEQLTQDPKTLEVPLVLSVYSTRNSDRVEISWDVPKELEVVGEKSFFISVNDITPTVIETKFKPIQAGRFEVKVKGQMFTAEVNYIASGSYTLPVGDTLEVLPISDEYKSAKMQYQTQEFLKYIGIALVVLTVVAGGGLLFKRWLDAEG